MSYAIICDARKGSGLGVKYLALIDRARSTRLWWTSDNPNIAICYKKKCAAEFAASRLRHNNARVVPFSQAQSILHSQMLSIREAEDDKEHETILDSMEEGWDGHKVWTGSY